MSSQSRIPLTRSLPAPVVQQEPISWWCGAVVILLTMLCAGLGWELWGTMGRCEELAAEKAEAWELNDELLGEMARWRTEADGLLEDRRLLLKQIEGAAGHLAEASKEKMRLRHLQEEAEARHQERERRWESYGSALESTLGATKMTLSQLSEEALRQQKAAAGQMLSLEGKLSALSESHTSLESKAKLTEQRAEGLSYENNQLQRNNVMLVAEGRRLEGCVAELRSHNTSLASEVTSLKAEVCRLEARIQCLKNELQEAKR
jgi:chromosome segregation ATPase